MTSFTAAGDSGTPQTITDGNTLTISGGTGLSSVTSATDTVTVNLDVPVTAANGGTGQTSYTSGDLLVATGTTTLSKLGIGTTGQVLTVSGGAPAWATPSGSGISVAELRYQVPQNTADQSISGSTWTTITLNTETSDPGNIVTIASNQFTPIAGTYTIQAIVCLPSHSARPVVLRVRNVTSGTTAIAGVNDQAGSAKQMFITGVITTNGTDAYAVQIFIGSTGGTVGSPINLAAVGDEIYMQIMLQKVG